MYKIVFGLLLIVSLPAISQKKQDKVVGLFIAQIAANNFKDADPIMGGSISFGARLHKIIGLGINAQLMKFKGDKNIYNPISGELSFCAPGHKFRPFCNMQVGKGIYSNTVTFRSGTSSFTSKVEGGLFLSPGVGIILPAKKQGGALITFSYINASFKSNTRVTGSGNDSGDYSIEGYRIGIGFML